MEWHITDAQNLSTIDREVGTHSFSPAEYEIVRRIIYATGDFEYLDLVQFSSSSLQAGAAALAARTPLIVDCLMIQAGITPTLHRTFANPVYCAMDAFTRPQKEKTQAAWGMETLTQHYPEGIFVIGQAQTALKALGDFIAQGSIHPALVIAVPAVFVEQEASKVSLQNSSIPSISITGRKGSAVVAKAIVEGLVELAWQAYGQA